MSHLRGNSDRDLRKTTNVASQFAQKIYSQVGGSLVYIEPKKTIDPESKKHVLTGNELIDLT